MLNSITFIVKTLFLQIIYSSKTSADILWIAFANSQKLTNKNNCSLSKFKMLSAIKNFRTGLFLDQVKALVL